MSNDNGDYMALSSLSAEPVACIHPDTLAMLNDPVQGRDGGICWRRSKLKFDQAYIPLYTAPPSLLAENARLREALERIHATTVDIISRDAASRAIRENKS